MNRLIASAGILFASAMAASNSSYADIGRANVSTVLIRLYGMYTTSDPSCRSGLQRTRPLSSTAVPFNMASIPAPNLGSGPGPSTINCVILVAQSNVLMGWRAGDYSGSRTNDGSDSVCNAGGTKEAYICQNSIAPSWQSDIETDAASVGLSLVRSCPTSGAASGAIPIYLSVNSGCYSNRTLDGGNAACDNTIAFSPPTSVGDTAHGIKLSAPGTGGSYKLIIDPNNIIGNTANGVGGNICDNTSAPRFSFASSGGN